MYGRKYMGIERTTFIIDGAGKIARIFEKVKVDGHHRHQRLEDPNPSPPVQPATISIFTTCPCYIRAERPLIMPNDVLAISRIHSSMPQGGSITSFESHRRAYQP